MGYKYEISHSLVSELMQLASASPESLSVAAPFRLFYEQMYRLLVRALNHQTAALSIEFSGPFARLDYLCRQLDYRNANPAGYEAIRSFRARCGQLSQWSEPDLQSWHRNDLKALAEFLLSLFSLPLPPELKALLPDSYRHRQVTELQHDSLRVVVDAVTDSFVHVLDLDDQPYRLPWQYRLWDSWQVDLSYLRRMLQPGTQLNLVRVHQVVAEPVVHVNLPAREQGREVHPELVVFEPDYLIDITAVCRCFTKLGPTPYQHLIDRLSLSDTTLPILLGNFAGQMLDEEVHGQTPYLDSVRRFFRENAIPIVACADLQSDAKVREFHESARAQQQNIRNIVHRVFSQDRTIQLDKVILEPSFVCERLGLQGRMDLLQSDKQVLMEQKSGKWDEYRHTHFETHYLQVLLYQAMLHYAYTDPAGHALRNDDIATYLLYSRYPDGLLKESPAPKLLFEAMMIRNQMVWLDRMCARGQIRPVLSALTPEHLIPAGQHATPFWDRYVRPSLADALNTLHAASPLEQDYYYRMLQFVSREHMLTKMGNSQKEASGFAALWNSTPAEKREAGSLLDGMTISSIDDSHSEITLSFAQTSDSLPNFRIGDIVILYHYLQGHEPDVRNDMVLRATIAGMSSSSVCLRLRAPQRNPSVFGLSQSPEGEWLPSVDSDWLWAIEPDCLESTYTGLYRGLFSFLLASPRRRSLLLSQRQPELDPQVRLIGSYGKFDTLVLQAMQAQDYFVLMGPPGTGKTSCGLVNILQEQLLHAGTSILLVSYTNRAVDEICSKLEQLGEPYLRIGHEMSCQPQFRPRLLGNVIARCATAQEIRNLIKGVRIMVSTTTSMTSSQALFGLKRFDLCIIDEASQILEPHLLPLLSARHGADDAIAKFVMIGDHKQLPAVVQQSESESAVTEPRLLQMGLQNCRQSLFERLFRSQSHASSSPFVYWLNAQGRMHHEVASFPNEVFYEGRLTEVPLQHQCRPIPYGSDRTLQRALSDWRFRLLTSSRFAFVPVRKLPSAQSVTDKVNLQEAQVIASLVAAVHELYADNGLPFCAHQSVGVIVPYRHQISTIRQQLEAYAIPELLDITIDTVERYQGSQRDVIIYGFTVSKEYQLEFLTNNVFLDINGQWVDRKLNVALTRAREINIVIGDDSLLRRDAIFASMIDAAQLFPIS